MKAAKWLLAAITILIALAVAGCEENQSYQARLSNQGRIRWEPTGTGWYHPDIGEQLYQVGK
jgi:hypothetical protein